MEYFRSLMFSRAGPTEAGKVKELEALEGSRWNWLGSRNKSRSIALREEYRKEVKERKEFLERMKANSILDQVAWDRVVSFVKEPKDLVNMWGMCEPWRKSVKLRITTTLFSEVFPKLVERGILSTNDVLNCRSVCKTWRDSVDRYMEAQELWRKGEVGDINVFNVNLPSPRLSANFFGGMDYEATLNNLFLIHLLRIVHGDEGAPAWGTKIFVRIFEDLGQGNEERGRSNLTSLQIACAFGIFFDKVTHLHLECDREDQSESFIGYIILMLENFSKNLDTVETLIVRGTRVEYQQVLAIRRLLGLRPFPRLKNLRTIVASSLHPLVIYAMLKTYGSHLETIVIDKGSHEIMTIIRDQELPCLKRLDFASHRYSEYECCYWRGRVQSTSRGLYWKTPLLEEVDLRFIEISNIVASSLIMSLEKFGWTLKKLQLTLQTTREQTLNFNSSLKLHVLEKLKLVLDGIHLGNIDFLIPSVHLKELDLTEVINWTKKVTSKQEKNEHIKFSSYRDRLYESNIWRMFPELKTVRIKLITKNVDGVADKNVKRVFVYDRYEYNQFKMNC